MELETEIKQWGNSLALRISRAMAQESAFARGSKVTVETFDSKMVITAKKQTNSFHCPFLKRHC